MALIATYASDLSRVRLEATLLDVTAVTAVVDRSVDLITWTVVRGGSALPVNAGVARLDDYEFAADVENFYRITAFDDNAVQTDQELDSVTPILGAVWWKNVARPFLNLQVRVVGLDATRRRARVGVFDVVGRSFPVAVTDLHSGRGYTLVIRTDTRSKAEDIDLIISTGDPMFLHVPPDLDYLWLPSGHYVLSDTQQARLGLPTKATDSDFTLPLQEIAAPAGTVVGSTATYRTLLRLYATYTDLLAAHATYADVLELIADPSEVIIP